MTQPGSPHTASGLLLLADITGYTAFLEAVASAHPEMSVHGGAVPPAYPILLSLLDVVSEELTPTFINVQTEGDAVFAYADADAVAGAHAQVVATVERAYAAFRGRIEQARVLQYDDCAACLVLGSLELKFIVHGGTFVVQDLPTRLHLAGPAVNLVHRLLKNGVTAQTGLRAYAFLSDAAAELVGLPVGAGATYHEASLDSGPVAGIVVALTGPGG